MSGSFVCLFPDLVWPLGGTPTPIVVALSIKTFFRGENLRKDVNENRVKRLIPFVFRSNTLKMEREGNRKIGSKLGPKDQYWYGDGLTS